MQDELLVEALNEALEKLDEQKDESKFEITVKKAIIEFCYRNGKSPTETLDFLNTALTLMNREAVTKGCVTHHLKNIKNKSDLTT
ncbi:hypothetical protein ACDN41_26820 [Priestia aryabhattai]|uniref:hypothetical protein n=1 Tax=Priestia aryabhattai TaxID=412384 RepID=UPI0035327701